MSELDKILKSLKSLYDRFLYLLVKPMAILLILVVTFKLIGYLFGSINSFFHIIISISLPFLIGIGLSILVEPINVFLEKKLKIPRIIAVSITLSTIILIISVLIFILFYLAISQMIDISNNVVHYVKNYDFNNIQSSTSNMLHKSFLSDYITTEDIEKYTIQLKDSSSKILQNFSSVLSSWGTSLAGGITKFFTNILPQIFVTGFVSIFTSFFISKDNNKLKKVINDYVPENIIAAVANVKLGILKNLYSYMKAQMILVSISGVILFIGFLVIKSPYAIGLLFLCMFLDLVPIVGTILLIAPWSIYAFSTGDMFTFYTLIISYVIAAIVRQIIEPKIVGDSLGFHPVLLLFALYAGTKLFGALGIILGPLLLILIKVLIDTKLIQIRKIEQENIENIEDIT